MADSREEIELLLRLLDLSGKVTVADGATTGLVDEHTRRTPRRPADHLRRPPGLGR